MKLAQLGTIKFTMRSYSTWPFIQALISANIFGKMYPTMMPKLFFGETSFSIDKRLLNPVELFKH